MNTNPKTYATLKWSDLMVSEDLTDYMINRLQIDESNRPDSYISKDMLADALEMLKDAALDEPEEFQPMLSELTEVSKIVKNKGIYAILVPYSF